jgi:BlaI family penicillinase repressor
LFHYHPLLCEADCIRKENRHLFELHYGGDANKMFTAFMEDIELSDGEIEQLQKMLERRKGGNNGE